MTIRIDKNPILVGGGTADPGLVDGTRDMAVLCLKGDGSVCPGFGTGGWSLIDFSDNSTFGIGNTDDSPRSIHWDYLTGLVTITGKVTQTTGAGDTYPAIARIAQSDGSLDTSFGTVGHRNYTETSGERFYGTISPSGNIVVVGAVDTGSPSDFDV